MKRNIALLTIALCAVAASTSADYSVADKGLWPETWPAELEGLRKHAKTYEGPLLPERRYLIPFTKREEFEAAWPHILKVKSKGAPIILVKGPKTDFFKIEPAGVLIKTPPVEEEAEVGGQKPGEGKDPGDRKQKQESEAGGQAPAAAAPARGERGAGSKERDATIITLVVDGKIVDLNRIQLPPDTPIVDERFKK